MRKGGREGREGQSERERGEKRRAEKERTRQIKERGNSEILRKIWTEQERKRETCKWAGCD